MTLEISTESRHSLIADLWLLLICIIWGASFPLLKNIIVNGQISPILLLAVRFWAACLILLPFVLMQKVPFTLNRFWRGSVLGLFMFLGMFFQMIGLVYTKPINSAFITGMAVIIVPLLVIILERRLPKLSIIIAVIAAVIGLYFLTEPKAQGFNRGDLFTLICAFSFALEILFIKLLIKPKESMIMAFTMIGITALLASIFALFEKPPRFVPVAEDLISLGFLSIFCTALAFGIQAHWQPRTSPIKASVIYTMEPVFASIFVLILSKQKEPITGSDILGGGLIFSGMLISELKRRR